MIENTWYANTAYDSRKSLRHSPHEPANLKKKDRALHPFLLHSGVECGEYRPLIEGAVRPSPGTAVDKIRLTHEQAEFDSVEVSKLSAWVIFGLCGLTFFIGLATAIVALTGGSPVKPAIALLFFGIPTMLFSKSLLKTITRIKKVRLNRRTGMVLHLDKTHNEDIKIPFAEFNGYFHSTKAADGEIYKLHIIHRTTQFRFYTGKKWPELSYLLMEWDFIQQYMDTSMPLPDVPSLEPYRHLDPTTAAYDKQNNRPPHYWRDIDLDELEKERKEGIKAIENFPWEKIPTDHIPD